VLGALQLVSTVIATGFLIFWKPIYYVAGAAFVWALAFSILVVRERQMKAALFQNKVSMDSADLGIARIYTLLTSLILAGFWPGLPILIWYDYGNDEAQTRSKGNARDL